MFWIDLSWLRFESALLISSQIAWECLASSHLFHLWRGRRPSSAVDPYKWHSRRSFSTTLGQNLGYFSKIHLQPSHQARKSRHMPRFWYKTQHARNGKKQSYLGRGHFKRVVATVHRYLCHPKKCFHPKPVFTKSIVVVAT